MVNGLDAAKETHCEVVEARPLANRQGLKVADARTPQTRKFWVFEEVLQEEVPIAYDVLECGGPHRLGVLAHLHREIAECQDDRDSAHDFSDCT
jgi:hypothetical protein